MDHFKRVYTSQAQEYDDLICAEDCDGNLHKVLSDLVSFKNKVVLDIGTGTGRIPLLFQSEALKIVGIDLYFAMLDRNKIHRDLASNPWDLVQGDMRRLPLRDYSFDITIAGWSIGHLQSWNPQQWKVAIGMIIDEMRRVTVKGGNIIVIETMGTGTLEPSPPTIGLAEYYRWLEMELKFNTSIIRTDYKFDSIDDAVQKTGFFFGDQLTQQIYKNRWSKVPEWTGIWWKQV